MDSLQALASVSGQRLETNGSIVTLRPHSDDPLPVGTLTFLLTDVEGSTRLWERDDEATALAIARHYEIVDEAVGQHGGVRPEEQGEGDSTVAVFARASDAVAAALSMQLAVQEEPWPESAALRLRLALHTGEAQLRDEVNYFGQALSRCARLRSIAHGGQTLLSRATHDVVVDNLPEGASLEDLGIHPLRDLARPEQVFQLCHPLLPGEFPSLRSFGSLPNNLPAQATSFIGREAEMSKIEELLRANRIATLTGSGGCGKTRLALEVARRLLDHYPDGVWWVELGSLNDPDLVPNAAASTLAIKEVPMQPLTQTVTGHLHDHRALLILDNCEHVIEACAELANAVVRGCPSVDVLATSREALGVDAETSWRVPSLTMPEERDPANVEAVAGYEAVRLFADRAARARPNFQLTDANAPAVSEICRRLGGIPLAIELAAARTRVLSPQQIAQGLSDRFRLLTGGSRTALARQQTLQASVDWSYNLLTEPERTVLRRLSVFAGNFTLEAAENICSDDGVETLEVLDLLSELVDRSLVHAEEVGSVPRFHLLETIRHYGLQKLADSGEGEAVRTRHLLFYLAFAEDGLPGLQGPDMPTALKAFDAEHDNLRTAMEWAVQSERVDEAFRFARPLFPFWFVRGAYSEGTRHIDAALARRDGKDELRAQALAVAGNLTVQLQDLPAARALAEEAVSLARDTDDPATLALTLYNLTFAESFFDSARARGIAEESLAILREIGTPFEIAVCITLRGIAEVQAGELSRARQSFEESMALLGDPANGWALQANLLWLGLALLSQGELALGESVVRRGIALSHELRDDVFVGLQLGTRVGLAVLGGRYEEVRADAEGALRVSQATNNPGISALVRAHLGIGAYAKSELDVATKQLKAAIQTWQLMGFQWPSVHALALLARVAEAQGHFEAGRAHADEALAVAHDCQNAVVTGEALVARARVASADADDRRAESLVREALRIFGRVGSKWGVIDGLETLTHVVARQGSHAEAARFLGSTESLRRATGYVRFPIEVPRFEADAVLIRQALGQDEFEAACAEGRGMTMEEAVAYASKGRGSRKRPATGWDSLTPAEADVVRLVAEGLSNPEIGKRLFISPRTVQAHLHHVFAKLGVSSRAELAAEAARRSA
jgi:predicted ATPase/class 3 adenylate cyclase/DNA-binding CsgD family transcriptional regulator